MVKKVKQVHKLMCDTLCRTIYICSFDLVPYNQLQSTLLLTLPYTTLLLIMSLYCCGRYRRSTLVLCVKLSTSALAPLSPSGLCHSNSTLSVELSLRASAS